MDLRGEARGKMRGSQRREDESQRREDETHLPSCLSSEMRGKIDLRGGNMTFIFPPLRSLHLPSSEIPSYSLL